MRILSDKLTSDGLKTFGEIIETDGEYKVIHRGTDYSQTFAIKKSAVIFGLQREIEYLNNLNESLKKNAKLAKEIKKIAGYEENND